MVLDILLIATGGAYIVSALGYALDFYQPKARWRVLSTWGIWGAWCMHTVLLGMITISAGEVPLTSQVLPSLCAWLVVVVYIYLEVSTQGRSLGVMIVPIVVVLHVLTLTKLLGTGDIQVTG